MNEAEPFPGSENFTANQVERITRTLGQMRELQPLAARSISEKTGIGGWLPSGFGDTRGMADIEMIVRTKCRAIVVLETAHLLGELMSSEEVVNLIIEDSLYEDMPGKVYNYLKERPASEKTL